MKVVKFGDIKFQPASHEDPKDPGVLKKILLAKDDLMSGRVQMINWAHLPVGKSFRRHYHEDLEEVFIIVSGECRMQVEDEIIELNRGDAILMAPMEKHEMINISKTAVDYIAIGITTGAGGKTVVV